MMRGHRNLNVGFFFLFWWLKKFWDGHFSFWRRETAFSATIVNREQHIQPIGKKNSYGTVQDRFWLVGVGIIMGEGEQKMEIKINLLK